MATFETMLGTLLGRLSFAALSVCVAGCISGGSGATDHPLYPESAGKLGPNQVARLLGYVHSVDGKDVSGMDGAFLLEPGCHLVVTPSEWGRGDFVTAAAVTVQTGPRPFVLAMEAGHQYVIEVRVGVMTGPTGSATVKAYDRDAEGKDVAEFSPAQSEVELQNCRERTPGTAAR